MALHYTAPNARLARELRQVATESARVADVLRGINHMPQTFPIVALTEICTALAQLQHGTAEGCNMPLTTARLILPQMRNDHFHFEGDEPNDLAQDAMVFLRDRPLDMAIMRLYGAVGTALEEYRAQAQEAYDDTVGPEEMITFGAGDEFAEINGLAQKVVQNTDSAGAEFARLNPPQNKPADDFARLLQDGSSAGHTVQSQIRSPSLSLRLYDATGSAVAKIPDALDKAGNALILGTDLGEIWVEKFSAFNKRIRFGVYDTLRDIANALKATAARLKQAQGAGGPAASQDDTDVATAEALVKEMLRNGTPVPKDLAEKVRVLDFLEGEDGHMSLVDRPQDLALLKNIHKLVGIRVDILTPLAQLTGLTSLTVSADSARDLTPLGRLKGLTSLTVSANRAHDLTPLGQLAGLTSLTVSANIATDLTPLAMLMGLTRLEIWVLGHDITPITALTNLADLTINMAKNLDLAPLTGLPRLEKLVLWNCTFKNRAKLPPGVELVLERSKPVYPPRRITN